MIDAALDFLPRGSKVVEEDIVWTRAGMSSRIDSLPVEVAAS